MTAAAVDERPWVVEADIDCFVEAYRSYCLVRFAAAAAVAVAGLVSSPASCGLAEPVGQAVAREGSADSAARIQIAAVQAADTSRFVECTMIGFAECTSFEACTDFVREPAAVLESRIDFVQGLVVVPERQTVHFAIQIGPAQVVETAHCTARLATQIALETALVGCTAGSADQIGSALDLAVVAQEGYTARLEGQIHLVLNPAMHQVGRS